jgi:hypothetical protein
MGYLRTLSANLFALCSVPPTRIFKPVGLLRVNSKRQLQQLRPMLVNIRCEQFRRLRWVLEKERQTVTDLTNHCWMTSPENIADMQEKS